MVAAVQTQPAAQKFYRPPYLPMIELRQARGTPACYQAHTHEEFSIGVVDGGVSDYFIYGRTASIGPGTTVVINPQTVHRCNPGQLQQWSYKMAYLDIAWLTELQAELSPVHSGQFQCFKLTQMTDVAHYQNYNRLFSLLTRSDSRLRMETALTSYFAALMLLDQQYDHPVFGKCVSHLQRAYDFIVEHCQADISIAEVAKEAGLSHYRLIHAFRQHYGITPHALQIASRISVARKMLKSGDRIADVAAETGFTDQSHFHRHFKRHVAVTPRQYQLPR